MEEITIEKNVSKLENLDAEEQEFGDLLIELGYLKKVYGQFNNEIFEEYFKKESLWHRNIEEYLEKFGHLHKGVIYVWYDYDGRTDNKRKFGQFTMDPWDFKRWLGRMIRTYTFEGLRRIKEFPILYKFMWGENQSTRRNVEMKYKSLKVKEEIKNGKNRYKIEFKKCISCGISIYGEDARILEGKKKIVLCQSCAELI